MKPSINNIYLDRGENTVVFNQMTGSRLTIKTSDFVNFFTDYRRFNSDQIDGLIKGGFIVNDECDEIKERIINYNKIQNDSSALIIHLVPSFNCNLECPYCFENNYLKNENINQFYYAVERLINNRIESLKYIHISFFGGEPLLSWTHAKDFLSKIDSTCRHNNVTYSTSVITNGLLINDSTINDFINYNCKLCQITLEGSKERHNRTRRSETITETYDVIVHNIEKVALTISNNSIIKLRINILNETDDEICEVLNSINYKVRNAIVVDFKSIFNTNGHRNDNQLDVDRINKLKECSYELGYKKLFNHNRFNPCEAGYNLNSFYITPDLHIWKCINNMNNHQSELGYLNTDGIITWLHERVIRWLQYADITQFNSSCVSCIHFIRCSGGCIMHRMTTGKVHCNKYKRVL